jgi:hypothetical protein
MKSQIEIRASVEGEITPQQLALIHSKLEAEIHRFLVSIIANNQVKGHIWNATHAENQSIQNAGLLVSPIA